MQCYEYALCKLSDSIRLKSLVTSSMRGTGPIRYCGAESADAFCDIEDESVDLIFSWGCLEHIEKPIEMFRDSKRILSKSGVALHTISTHAHTWHVCPNPLTFLSVPDWLWSLMYWRRGFINRFMPSDNVKWARETGYDVVELGRECADASLLEIKPRLLDRYRNASDQDLLTIDIMLALTKDRAKP